MIAGLATGLAGAGGLGGGGGTSSAYSGISNSDVNINPNVNIGAILQPYNSGSVQNGGMPINTNRYCPQAYANNSTLQVSTGINPLILLAGAGGLLLVVFLAKRR